MIVKSSFDIVEVSGEYMAIPIGDVTTSFRGVVALSDAGAFLLRQMRTPKTISELVHLLITEYDVDKDTAEHDAKCFVDKLFQLGLIEE